MDEYRWSCPHDDFSDAVAANVAGMIAGSVQVPQ
jgi:hypothetical protein